MLRLPHQPADQIRGRAAPAAEQGPADGVYGAGVRVRRGAGEDAEGPHGGGDRGGGAEGPAVRAGAVGDGHLRAGERGTLAGARRGHGQSRQRDEAGLSGAADADGGAGNAAGGLGAGGQLYAAQPPGGTEGNRAVFTARGQRRNRVPRQPCQQLSDAEGHTERRPEGAAGADRRGAGRSPGPEAGVFAGAVMHAFKKGFPQGSPFAVQSAP